jgi:endonuclease/exonuclease/phosphatase family metal-dependent hydrolase
MTTQISIASFNLHAGVDGWGRRFDAVAACRVIDADVLVVQESWKPTGGISMAATIGAALGYSVFEHQLAAGRRAGAHPQAGLRWMRPLDWRGTSHALFIDSERPLPAKVTDGWRFQEAESGTWSLAVLSRLPVAAHRFIALPTLRRDVTRRGALILSVGAVTVVGTHMSHLTYGSPAHFRKLARILDAEIGDGPAVLAGDMNLWGPLVRRFFVGWHQAARGRTWPAWRPHSQLDHILVRGPLDVRDGRVVALAVSDHRPVRVTLAVPDVSEGPWDT